MDKMVGLEPGARYLRSRDGVRVHRADCTHESGVTWNFADDYDADQIVVVLAHYVWLKPCKHCGPDRRRASSVTRREGA